MKELWQRIDFVPDKFELLDDNDTSGSLIMDCDKFPRLQPKTPAKPSDPEKYCGLTIKNLPISLSNSEVYEFLGDYDISKDASNLKININRSAKTISVTIDNLDPKLVNDVIEAVDFPKCRKKFFNVPLYCRPLRVQTPLKSKTTIPDSAETSTASPVKSAGSKTPNKSGNKPISTQLIGGVKFKNMSDKMNEYDFNEVDIFKDKPSNKRNSANRSPLEVKRDAKIVKV